MFYMFYIELKPKINNKAIYEVHFSIIESNLNYHIPNMRFFNTLIAKDMAIQKVFAFEMRQTRTKSFNHQLSLHRKI